VTRYQSKSRAKIYSYKETYEQWIFRMSLYRLRLSTKSEKAIKEHFKLLEKTKIGDENNIIVKTL